MANPSLEERVAHLESLVVSMGELFSDLHNRIRVADELVKAVAVASGSGGPLLDAHAYMTRVTQDDLLFRPFSDEDIEATKAHNEKVRKIILDLTALGRASSGTAP